jgi:hypothetical protein
MLCDAVIVGVDDRLAACLTINRLKQELPIYFFLSYQLHIVPNFTVPTTVMRIDKNCHSYISLHNN